MVIPFADADMSVKASLVFEKQGMPNFRTKKSSVDHIKEKYFTKITPEDFHAEKKRLFDARRIQSAFAQASEGIPKTPLRVSQIKLDHIREFQLTKQARNRAMSAFHAEKLDVRNSIQQFVIGIFQNLEHKSSFRSSWEQAIQLLRLLTQLRPLVEQRQEQRLQYPEEVKTLFFFFSMLKTEVPLKYKRFVDQTSKSSQLVCVIKSNIKAQICREKARGIARKFLEGLSRRMVLESKMQYHGDNC
jgi:hypothetical protein